MKFAPRKNRHVTRKNFKVFQFVDDFDVTDNLLDLVNGKNARILMQETCWFCHKATDYDRWIGEAATADFGVSYTVPFTKTWMPFYIAKRNSCPKFDENVYFYGYDRLIQVC